MTQIAPCHWTQSSRAPVIPGEREGLAIPPCAVCGAPSTHRSYDGLDPNAQFNPRTGRYWSTDVAHYPPLCEAH